jgi:hypothetical protein
MTEQELLKDCLARLNRSSIDYMLVGSMASNYWGIPRSTHDIDFVVEYGQEDVDTIVRLFEDDFFIQEISVRSALKPPYQFNALDNRSALKVDFFRLAGDAYDLERFKRRQSAKILGQTAFLAAPEDVILYKLRGTILVHQIDNLPIPLAYFPFPVTSLSTAIWNTGPMRSAW